MTRAQNPHDEHRAEELYVYSALQKSDGLPAARHEDNPDFRVQLGGTTLGVELTRFHYDKGAAGSTESRDHRLRAQVLGQAHATDDGAHPDQPLLVTCHWLWHFDIGKANRRDLSARLAALIHEARGSLSLHTMPATRTEIPRPMVERHGLTPVFYAVSLVNLPAGKASSWPNLWTNTAATVPTQLDDLIREKEKKLPTYRRSCQEVWLLIYNLLGALDIDLHVTSPTYRTDFDRVYLFDGFGRPVRLKTDGPDPHAL